MKLLFFLVLSFSFLNVARAEKLETPKAEFEMLMNSILPLAQQMLREEGEFFPYGGALGNTGKVSMLAGYDGRERPPAIDVINLLKHGFVVGARSGDYKATALVYDVRIALPSSGGKSDAIAVSLNHRSNYSVIVYFPYVLTKGVLTYGEVFAQRGDFEVFTTK